MLRKLLYLVSALLLGAGAFSGVQASGATFTDTSVTPLNIFSAPDWTAPNVSIVDPGYAVTGTVTVSATATDGDTTIDHVTIQRAPHGSSTWTTICNDNSSPYSCSWDTTPLTDGEYDLRAVAVDAHANSRTSTSVMTTVQNSAGVVLDPVVGPVRGTVTLTGRIVNATGSATIAFQATTSGTNGWFEIPGCGAAAGLVRTCQVDTTSISGYYDWRAVGVINGNTYYDVESHVMVDNTLPSASLTVPAAPLSGTVNMSATASDAHSGVASVRFEYRRVGVTAWTTCALDTVAPYTCSLNTTGLADGSYEFRATATDVAGNATTTAVTTRTITNGGITLAALPVAIKGTYGLSATWNGPGTPNVVFARSATGTGNWTTLTGCSARPATPTATCSWDTLAGALDSQRWYIRAQTTVSAVTYESIRSTVVDNEVPDVALTVPAAPLYGTVSLSATADDTDPNAGDESSGIASVLFEYRRTGPGQSWTACGTADTTSPYACSLNTTGLTTGTYEFRATATDGAGNTTTTTLQSRTVDNTPKVTLTAPATGSYPQNSVITVSADAWAMPGVTSVAFQYDPPGPTSWQTICTDTGAPYTCNWNTAGVALGASVVRAVMTPVTGAVVNSATATVTLEQLRGASVDATNVDDTGEPAATDRITLTYSTLVNLNTVRPATWNGSSTAVTVTLADPAGPTAETLTVNGTNLGSVTFGQDYVDDTRTVTFNATMVATTVGSGSAQATQITITLGTVASGAVYLNDAGTATGTMRWTPSASVRDTFGNACLTTVVNEAGAADVDL